MPSGEATEALASGRKYWQRDAAGEKGTERRSVIESAIGYTKTDGKELEGSYLVSKLECKITTLHRDIGRNSASPQEVEGRGVALTCLSWPENIININMPVGDFCKSVLKSSCK